MVRTRPTIGPLKHSGTASGISDSQHTQIATLLNRLGLPDSGWIARKPVYKSPEWANGFPFTKRDSIRGLMGVD